MPIRTNALRRPDKVGRTGAVGICLSLKQTLQALGLERPLPVRRLYPRRDDVVLGGRPTTLLLKTTTPLLRPVAGGKRI